MTEVIEYTLVVMVSVLFVAGSAAVYTSFSSLESQLQLRAMSAAVSALVDQAVRNGSSVATLSLPDSTISCNGDTLRLTAGSATGTLPSLLPCDFDVKVEAGAHELQFFSSQSLLTMKVG
jgi:uncharacterized protein (UPF0333 family)